MSVISKTLQVSGVLIGAVSSAAFTIEAANVAGLPSLATYAILFMLGTSFIGLSLLLNESNDEIGDETYD